MDVKFGRWGSGVRGTDTQYCIRSDVASELMIDQQQRHGGASPFVLHKPRWFRMIIEESCQYAGEFPTIA